MDACVFCDEEKYKEDIISNGNNFFIKVGFGLMAPGHVLLVSKEHYRCFGDLPDLLEEEHQRLKESFIEKITKKFAKPFLIEYGIWGQSVFHAHKHIIPSRNQDYNIESIIEEVIIKGEIDFEEVNVKKLKEIYKLEGSYVSIEEGGRMYLCHVKSLPNNREHPYLNLRPFFSQKNGLKGIEDWANIPPEHKQLDEHKRILTKRGLID
ncbi:MAG: HIT domain-containing protein [Nanoarchaeota archaeon]